MNKTIHELNSLAQAQADDELIIYDVSEGESKKIQVQALNNPNYSTTEQLTGGKWIDGKPIYRKIITGLSYQSYWDDNWKSVYFDISSSLFIGIDKILEFRCIANNGNVTYGMLNDNRTSVNILNTRNSASYPTINTVIVEYTKTTD